VSKKSSPTLEIFTDTKEFSNISSIAAGYVIKYENLEPLIGCSVYNDNQPFKLEVEDYKGKSHVKKYKGLHNSAGEMVAAFDGLEAAECYCSEIGVDPKECTVIIKTDFKFLKTILKDSLNPNKEYKNNNDKRELLNKLLEAKNRFKEVMPELIQGDTNLAHRICDLEMETYIEKVFRKVVEEIAYRKSSNKVKSDFYEIYENTDLCIPQ
jgi:hypothetical protein